MGLRITQNVAVLTALRNLARSDRAQTATFEKLSTGLEINRSSDDPTGLAISERMRSEIAALRQVTENAGRDANLLATADTALDSVLEQLRSVRASAIFALSSGTANADQVRAEQESVDASLAAIDAVARTTRFGGRELLDGAQAIAVASSLPPEIREVTPIRVRFDPASQRTIFSLQVLAPASQAVLSAVGGSGIVASGGAIKLRISGPLGTEVFELASGATAAEFDVAVNNRRGATGVFASGGVLATETFGSDQAVRVELVEGPGAFSGAGGLLSQGDVGRDTGADVQALLNGSAVAGRGNSIRANAPGFTGDIELAPGVGPSGPGGFTFALEESGLAFQIGTRATDPDRETVGIPGIRTDLLGAPAETVAGVTTLGFLDTVRGGGANDLRANPGNALRIIDAAIEDVARARSELGSFQANRVEGAERQAGVAIEQLTRSESSIRDLDFARAAAELSRQQVIFQAGQSVLGQAINIQGAILELLR